jgi:streptogramin lyase
MRAVLLLTIAVAVCSSASASTRIAFELPYDLAVGRDGTVYFPDRKRILALHPASGRVRLVARVVDARELVGLARLKDGTLFATDLPTGQIFRVRPGARPTTIANVPEPVDVVADPTGTTLWIASIAEGVGLVRVDVESGDVDSFADVERPHGVDRDARGDFVVHDGHAVSWVDGASGDVTRLAAVDAVKVAIARDGTVYGVVGTPSGGRIVRIARDGRVTRVAGTGKLGRHRDGEALRAPMLPSAVALARDGSLLVAQIEPIPAIRRINLASGRITTLARGR